jgi:hypothetical protein
MKELLGTLSPVYGMATGKGLFGNAVGVLPAIAKDMRDESARNKKKKRDKAGREIPVTADDVGMKKGGSVKYAKGGKVTRGDGICKKGHTKGKMV